MPRKTRHLINITKFSPNFTLDSVADSNYRGKCDVGGFLIFEWTLSSKGEIHETLQICKLLTKRQIQCCNNVSCHGFEFSPPYRALPSFVNNPLRLFFPMGPKYFLNFILPQKDFSPVNSRNISGYRNNFSQMKYQISLFLNSKKNSVLNIQINQLPSAVSMF
jgi:hypothetical protein